MKTTGIAILLAFLTASGTQAQEQYLELLRSDVRTERVAIITEAMQLSEEEAGVFWPIYRNYEFESSQLGDRRIQLIKDYAEFYENMTDDVAKDLVQRALKIEEDRTKLRKKFFDQFRRELPATIVARFFQIDNQLNLLIDLQIAAELPLVKRPAGG
jgi:hypothetical protein